MTSIVVRGLALVGLVLFVVLCPSVPMFRSLKNEVAFVVPSLLFGYWVIVMVERIVRGRPPEEARSTAWSRAREIDPADAGLALLVAGWVPVALLAALVVLAWPHLNDPDAATRGVWGAIGVPALVVAWLFAANAWLEGSRDELARAIGESDRRFRTYWANVGR